MTGKTAGIGHTAEEVLVAIGYETRIARCSVFGGIFRTCERPRDAGVMAGLVTMDVPEAVPAEKVIYSQLVKIASA